MGLSIEQQREAIRAKKKENGEFVSVTKVKRKRIKKKGKNKSIKKKFKKQKYNKYKQYLLSDEWAQLKIDLFKHRGYACEQCSSKKKLNVHHIHYKNLFNEEPEDLIILCVKCHMAEHKRLNQLKKTKKKIPK